MIYNKGMNYFILTIKESEYDDIDFKRYSYNPRRNNKLKIGDWVIFHRSKRGSEINQFYFFGAAKIKEITEANNKTCYFNQIIIFEEYLKQEDIKQLEQVKQFIWTFRERGKTYERFFNQYGITQINKRDFEQLLQASGELGVMSSYDREKENLESGIKTDWKSIKRRISQTKWSEYIKKSSDYKCVISGIKQKGLVEAAHILPSSVAPEKNAEFDNGIALTNYYHRLFDLNIISFTEEWNIIINYQNIESNILKEQLNKIDGQKAMLGKNKPNYQYIKERNEISN